MSVTQKSRNIYNWRRREWHPPSSPLLNMRSLHTPYDRLIMHVQKSWHIRRSNRTNDLPWITRALVSVSCVFSGRGGREGPSEGRRRRRRRIGLSWASSRMLVALLPYRRRYQNSLVHRRSPSLTATPTSARPNIVTPLCRRMGDDRGLPWRVWDELGIRGWGGYERMSALARVSRTTPGWSGSTNCYETGLFPMKEREGDPAAWSRHWDGQLGEGEGGIVAANSYSTFDYQLLIALSMWLPSGYQVVGAVWVGVRAGVTASGRAGDPCMAVCGTRYTTQLCAHYPHKPMPAVPPRHELHKIPLVSIFSTPCSPLLLTPTSLLSYLEHHPWHHLSAHQQDRKG